MSCVLYLCYVYDIYIIYLYPYVICNIFIYRLYLLNMLCVLYLYMYCMHIYIYGKREEENKGRKKDMCNVVAFGPASGLGRSRAGCKLQLDVRFGVGVVHRTAGR